MASRGCYRGGLDGIATAILLRFRVVCRTMATAPADGLMHRSGGKVMPIHRPRAEAEESHPRGTVTLHRLRFGNRSATIVDSGNR